ncbi:MAG TPA: carbon-nitrogen hydrolase family protein [Streptosporangiaceae bacterium]
MVRPVLDRAVVGIAQWLPRPGDAAANLAAALGLIAKLGGRRCDLIVLPELWPSGYSPKTLAGDVAASAEPLDGPRTAALARAAAAAGAWLAAGSVPERDGADVYNTALLFGRDGELRGVHRKAHLYAPLGEDLIFAAGPRLTVCPTEDFGVVGLPVCFDGDFPETARALRLAGARVVVQASAYEVEAQGWWDGLYPARALENGQWWVMSNQCGRTPSGVLLGGSQVISPLGRVVSRAVKVGEVADQAGPALLVAEIALREELAEADRLNAALWENRREELYARAEAWAPG